jgi:hypothetical protein
MSRSPAAAFSLIACRPPFRAAIQIALQRTPQIELEPARLQAQPHPQLPDQVGHQALDRLDFSRQRRKSLRRSTSLLYVSVTSITADLRCAAFSGLWSGAAYWVAQRRRRGTGRPARSLKAPDPVSSILSPASQNAETLVEQGDVLAVTRVRAE